MRIQHELLAIPGHAEYFARKIREARAAARDPYRDSDYQEKQARYFETLGHLPSEETVCELGKMLEEGLDVPSDELRRKLLLDGAGSTFFYSVMPDSAAIALSDLRIEDPAFRFDQGRGGCGREQWLQWWKEVKEGKRRYRFEGTEEWLPKASAAPPPGMRRPPKEDLLPGQQGADGRAQAGVGESLGRERSSGTGLRWLWIAAATTVTASCLWWIKRRGNAAGGV